MTSLAASSDLATASEKPQALLHPFLVIVFVGMCIGTVVAFGLYVTKAAYVALLPFSLLLVIPALLVKNFRVYWFAIFLLSLQAPLTKSLNDGLAVLERLQIDYTIWNFTFDITATDLVLLVLLVIWVNDALFHQKVFRFPSVTWLAVAYLVSCLLSTLAAPSSYLGFVEMWRQMKLFIVYLFAVNCLDSKSAVRALALIGVIILVIQAGMTVARFETGYLTPLGLGEVRQDLSQIQQYLTVDRFAQVSAVRAYGTLGSPGSTIRLCMMVIPFALFLCVPNALFKRWLLFVGLTTFSLLGLVLTFTRVYYIITFIQIVLAFLSMIRDRMLKRKEALLLFLLGLAALALASPKIYWQFTVREDSASVRWLQYKAVAKMILDNPILGVGLNNSTGQKPKYVDVTYNQFDPNTQFYLEPTHNLYLNLASEVGIFGALVFVTFFTKAALIAWRQGHSSSDPEIRLLANALFVAFCGVAVSGCMDPLQEYPVLMLLWLYAGLCLNLSRMRDKAEKCVELNVRMPQLLT
jgi:O-Antigen ligase